MSATGGLSAVLLGALNFSRFPLTRCEVGVSFSRTGINWVVLCTRRNVNIITVVLATIVNS